MNTQASIIYRLYKALQFKKGESINLTEMFPDYFDPNNNKINVLFISPRMDVHGYYKQILPAVWLNFVGSKISCCITNIAKSRQELDSTPPSGLAEISEDLIRSSDVIVFPFLHQDLSLPYKAIRGQNPDAKIIFNVDYNFYDVPKSHRSHEILSNPEAISTIESNIFYADKTFVPTDEFGKLLEKNLHGKFELPDPTEEPRKFPVSTIDYYLEKINFKGIDENITFLPLDKSEGKIRLGIICSEHTKEDIIEYQSVLKWVNETYPDKVELLIWGIDPFLEEPEAPVENGELKEIIRQKKKGRKKAGEIRLDYRRFRGDSYIYYYKDLYQLNLDGLLILRKPTDFNKYNMEPQEFTDALFFEVPVISNIDSKIFKKNKEYLFGKNKTELKQQIKKLVKNYDFAKSTAVKAKDNILTNRVYSADRWSKTEKAFIV